MSDAQRSWVWRTFRYDIGRKVMAFGLASVLWYLLFTWVVEKDGKSLPVVSVATIDDARQQAEITPGVYLVVPEGLIVRESRPAKVDIDYAGRREDISDLRPSVIIELSDALLGNADEDELEFAITRNKFRFRGDEPDFSEFKIRDEKLVVDAVRETTADIAISAVNARVLGSPQENYSYESGSISTFPNTISVRGPKPVIDGFLRDPSSLVLEPVSVEGRLGQVRQPVDLAEELRARQVELLGPLVMVTVPIQPDPSSQELRSVPIEYVGVDDLALEGLRVKDTTLEVDLLVSGPKSIVNRGEEWLRRRIFLRHEWSSDLEEGREDVKVVIDLADADELQQLTVTDMMGNTPQITFELEAIEDG